MIEKLSGIKLKLGEDERVLVEKAEAVLGVKPLYFKILKKSLDARNKKDIYWTYSIEFSAEKPVENEPLPVVPNSRVPSDPVIIVGAGPCGLS